MFNGFCFIYSVPNTGSHDEEGGCALKAKSVGAWIQIRRWFDTVVVQG